MESTTAATASANDEPKPKMSPLRILELVKSAQQQHGLRQQNYLRYRGYCGRRVERIRKSLKFTNIYKCLPKRPGKFVARTVTPELVADIRYLEIVVFQVERNWAYAMECKLDTVDKPLSRKKFGMRQKLRKAVKWANFLESLVEDNELVQPITKMESKAYTAFIRASLALELKDWKAAVAHFDAARSGYAALLEEYRGMDFSEIYLNKCREMEKLLKLCRSESGDADVLLSSVDALNLNASELEESQKPTAMEVEEPKAAAKLTPKQQRKAARKEPKPFKPFFFDLALNFVKQSTT